MRKRAARPCRGLTLGLWPRLAAPAFEPLRCVKFGRALGGGLAGLGLSGLSGRIGRGQGPGGARRCGRILHHQAQLIPQRPRAEFAHPPRFQIAQREGAVSRADQPVDHQAHGLHRAADFSVAALADADGQPGIRALLAVDAHGHGLEHLALDGDARAQGGEAGLVRGAVDADPVFAQPAGRGQFQLAFQRAVIGQQEQPFGIQVQPPHAHHPRHVLGQGVENRGAALFVARSADDAGGLVIEPKPRRFGRGQGLSVHQNPVARPDVQRRRGDHRAIHPDAALRDHHLRIPARGKARTRQHLGDALARRGGGCGFGRGCARLGHGALLGGLAMRGRGGHCFAA